MFTLSGCGDVTAPTPGSKPATEVYAASLGVDITQMTKKSDDLYVQDLVVGTGADVTAGHVLGVTYTGWFTNATQFDSNVGGTPLSFTLGAGQVILGWDLGLPGMKVGGKRRLVIGSDLAYGSGGAGCDPNRTPRCVIPPNSTLVFDVQVLSSR